MKPYLLFVFLAIAISAEEMSLPFPEPAEEQNEVQKNETAENAETAIEEKKAAEIKPAVANKKKTVKTKKQKKSGDKKNSRDKSGNDVSFRMGKSQLKTGKLEDAEKSFSQGEKTPEASMELVQIKMKQGKYEDALKEAEAIADENMQMKARLGLANRLLSRYHDIKSYDMAMNQYYRIIASDNEYKAAALWGLSQLFYKKKKFRESLDNLTRIILENPESEFTDDAYYLCGRIYEAPGEFKNHENARIFYRKFLANMDKKNFQTSIYADEVKKRLARLELR